MAKVHSGEEILPKVSTPQVGRTNVTDDRQTDDRQTTDRRISNNFISHVTTFLHILASSNDCQNFRFFLSVGWYVHKRSTVFCV